MIRKFNYTGRKKIVRARVPVTLRQEAGGLFAFDAVINLEGLGLPEEADVFVEAYHRTSYMRFPFGKVGDITPPDNRLLAEVEPGVLPHFRIKVVMEGRILASADTIMPRRSEDEPKDKLSLLPVEFQDLGDLIWRLDLSNGPVLQLNSAIEDIREIARSDQSFFVLVYPEIIRQVLRYILVVEKYSDEECDEEDWQSGWLRFAKGLPGIERPPSADYLTTVQDREDWIEDVVMAFCRKWRVRDRFEESVL